VGQTVQYAAAAQSQRGSTWHQRVSGQPSLYVGMEGVCSLLRAFLGRIQERTSATTVSVLTKSAV
jgi:nitrogenase molybdenum-iron protein alpha/beta subunit